MELVKRNSIPVRIMHIDEVYCFFNLHASIVLPGRRIYRICPAQRRSIRPDEINLVEAVCEYMQVDTVQYMIPPI